MQITAVDDQHNLFRVTEAVSPELAQQVLATDWIMLPWRRQPGQESWSRRLINIDFIPWIDKWNQEMQRAWPILEQHLNVKLLPYMGSAFWIDEPGFVCGMHTDGEMPGSLHLTWTGPATCFYWHNNTDSVRYQVPAEANSGYAMINQADSNGSRKLMWHDMSTPVAEGTFRLTTYTWLQPK